MTGTAETEAAELFQIYKLDVVVMPTNEPVRRVDSEDLIFRTKREKYNAIVDEIERVERQEPAGSRGYHQRRNVGVVIPHVKAQGD